MARQTRKKLSSKGWAMLAPGRQERRVMQKDCGRHCFLGPVGENCFPICTKNTCTVNDQGVYAAYVRAREYGSPNKRSRRRKGRSKRRSSSSSKRDGHHHSKKTYLKIASKAKTQLKKRGYGPNLS